MVKMALEMTFYKNSTEKSNTAANGVDLTVIDDVIFDIFQIFIILTMIHHYQPEDVHC